MPPHGRKRGICQRAAAGDVRMGKTAHPVRDCGVFTHVLGHRFNRGLAREARLVMNKTQAGRLLTLAYFLKTEVPRSKFDMGQYFSTVCDESRYPYPIVPVAELQDSTCNSSACALGWCIIAFPDAWENPCYPHIKKHSGPVDSAKEFFGLTYDDVELAFYGGFERTPMQEAKILEGIAAKYGYTYA